MIALLLLAGSFAGSQSCVPCHPSQSAAQAQSHHARALRLDDAGRWAFGAGAQATTYVSRIDEDTYLEHGLSDYRRGGRALTPGHHDARGVRYPVFAPQSALLRCFECHSTGTLTLGEGQAVVPSEPGVHCESCHGPASEHIARPGPGNIRNPGKWTGSEMNTRCGQCHRMPPAQGVTTNFENPWNVRHQPVYFSQSACFLRSKDTLSCVSCHDPHQDGVLRAAAQCSSCHAKPRHSEANAARASSAASCIGCHMPAVQPSPQLRFVNHWIGVYQLTGPRANPLRPLTKGSSGVTAPRLLQ